jgi:xylulokinase
MGFRDRPGVVVGKDMNRTLTFDLGTSYFKVCLFDQRLQLVARHSAPVPTTAPEPGRCELRVTEFRRCLTDAVRELARQVGGLQEVQSICFASQANTFTLLDGKDSPLVPLILWSDRRALGLEEAMQSYANAPGFYAETGVAQFDHQFMVAKLRWLCSNSPDVSARARRVCTISDYFTWWLTGNFIGEAGLAGLTGLIDIHTLQYRPELLGELGITAESLPPIVRAGSDAGPIRKKVADDWGLGPECRLVMGCLDQYAGAIGAGITTAGGVCETTGTVLATMRCAHGFNPRATAGVFQGPAFAPDLYYQMVFSSLSAGILERYRNRLLDRPTFEELDRLAAEVPSGCEGLRFNPVAMLDASADMFVGRTAAHGCGHEVRAIMEAVAGELRGQVTTLCDSDLPASIKSGGGAARSQLWLQIKREVVGCEFERVDSPEPTSLGAARLASWANGS